VVVALKMCGAPLHGELAQALVTSASYPTAVNSALVAIEYDNEPEFAVRRRLYSTLVRPHGIADDLSGA
jgi:predicted permease